MLNPLFEENLHQAKHAFKEARSENIIGICEKCLMLLNDFRQELYKFRNSPEINLMRAADSSSREAILDKRREIHAAIKHTVQELNLTTALLNWLTAPKPIRNSRDI